MEQIQEILKRHQISEKSYIENHSELDKQKKLKNNIAFLDAFDKCINSLFIDNETADNFFNLISVDPEAFELSEECSAEEIKNKIIELINEDSNFKIALLPIEIEKAPYNFKLFPPENGESTDDYWIWYIQCEFFPGPYWMLSKRDNSEEAYSYGYM